MNHRRISVLAAVVGLAVTQASAQSADSFYKGKSISIVVFSGPGGAYDTYSRLLSRHLGKHLDGNPSIIVRNMPGAGGITAARHLAEVAAKDGTVIGSLSRTLIYEPLLGSNAAKLDYNAFGWIGSMAQSTAVYVSWHTSRIKAVADLYQKDLLIAGTGAASETTIVSNILNGILGTHLKLINGYDGSSAALKAMEAGEVDGGFPTMEALHSTHPDWIRDKKINFLFQARQVPDPELPGVPTANQLAKTEKQRKALDFVFPRDVIGRPFAVPPGVPKARLDELRKAFDATLNDPELQNEAKKMHIPIHPTRGDELADVIADAYRTPRDIVQYVRQFLPKE
jgi:tripartite-type tricarboxylate transporter receptor subunit TctC